MACKDTVPTLKTANGDTITESEEKCRLFLNHFGSVFQNDNGILPNIPQLTEATFCYVEFSPETVYAYLHDLPNKFSSGPDEINQYFLKQTALQVALPLSIIYTKSFNTSALPADWLCANVIPIFKKGNKSAPDNYRPISLTCVVCKVMEAIIKDALLRYLNFNNLISPEQHGFRRKHSTSTQLLEYLNFVTKNVDKGHNVDVLYLDFAKAFDTVSHVKLLYILQNVYGIHGKLLWWLKAFLTNRNQRVHIQGVYSEWSSVPSSVIQGSAIGPLLFLLFINSLPKVICSEHIKIKLFADDAKVYTAMSKENQHAIFSQFQKAIEQIFGWTQNMQLQLALHKCSVLHLGGTNPCHTYTMNGIPIPSVKQCNDLGVIITSDMKFSAHCAHIAKSAALSAAMIYKAFNTRNRNTLVQLFKTYVRPKLENSTVIWSSHLVRDIDLVESIQ